MFDSLDTPLVRIAVTALIKGGLLLGGIMTAAAYFVLLERRVCAWMQDRRGPNRVGIPWSLVHPSWRDWKLSGLFQPAADGLKMILKEEYTPGHVDRRLFLLAPLLIMSAALAIFAVIPFGSTLPPISIFGWQVTDAPTPLIIAPRLDVGLIYVFALSSIAVYGVILGGWASNNKYSFLGGLRSSAQMIAYELPLGLGILGVILATGSLRLDVIMDQQADSAWFAFAQPLGFLVFVVAAFAEAARLPFDLPECEQELVGGYHTEYAGMKLVLFLTAEFIHMITASFLIAILFLGGWHLAGVTGGPDTPITWGLALIRIAVLFAKIFCVVLFFMLVRWSWPRFRFDQLMTLAWKVMLPLGLVNLLAVALVTEAQAMGWLASDSPWFGIAIGWCVLIFAWVVVALVTPQIADNRPRRDLESYGVDSQM